MGSCLIPGFPFLSHYFRCGSLDRRLTKEEMPEGHVSLQAGIYHFEYSDILAIASRWEYESLSHLHAKMPSPRDRGLPSTSTSILPLSIPIKQCQDYQLVIPPSFTLRAVTFHVRSLHSRDTNFQGIKRPSENPVGGIDRRLTR